MAVAGDAESWKRSCHGSTPVIAIAGAAPDKTPAAGYRVVADAVVGPKPSQPQKHTSALTAAGA
ncbi:MAG TPA: hypothetical protein VEF89_22955 [Solirubrobacteraceae bacterium]|nr:hypothetical protein [Solirubrobacteraceae bacterium]